MLKKIGFVATAAVAGVLAMGSAASADPDWDWDGGDRPGWDRGDRPGLDETTQLGLVNLQNTELLENLSVPICAEDLVELIEVDEILEHVQLQLPLLSPGAEDQAAQSEVCASSEMVQGTSDMGN